MVYSRTRKAPNRKQRQLKQLKPLKNAPGTYYGYSETPYGLGYSALFEKPGKKMKGRDGHSYTVRVSQSNGRHFWERSQRRHLKPLTTTKPKLRVSPSKSRQHKLLRILKKPQARKLTPKKVTFEKVSPQRKAPLRTANKYPGQTRKGADGKTMYISRKLRNGRFRWVKVR